jgi:hypothetical protein
MPVLGIPEDVGRELREIVVGDITIKHQGLECKEGDVVEEIGG